MYKKIFVILAIFLVVASGCTNKTKEELLSEGKKQLNENNPNAAIIYLKNALEKDPNFFDARFQLSKAYLTAGKIDSAENELQKLSRQDPNSTNVKVELARVYLQKAKPDEAIKEISVLINNSSNNIDALEIAGLAYAIKRDYATAESLLKKALSNDKATPKTSLTLARIYSMMGKTEDARLQISEVLGKEPSNRNGLYLLAELQINSRDIDGAINTYDKILNTNPSDIEASSRKGMLLIEKGRYDDVISMSDELIKKSPKRPEGYRLKGIALFYKKQFSDAIVELQKSLSIYPDVLAYYFLGLSHYSKNELEQAMSQLQKASELNPSFTQARALVSLILLKKNRTDDAINEIKKVLEKDENNALAHNILGSAYLSKGMHSEGMASLNRAIEIDPKLVDVHIKKGLFALSKGRLKAAESELKTAVEANPEISNTRIMLASYYLNQKEYDKAIKILNEGIKGQKTDAVFYNLIAETLLRQNKTAEAGKYLIKAKDSNPDYPASYYNLARLHILKGNHEAGMQELKILIGKSPDDIRALVTLASLLETKGKESEAFKYYSQAKETGKTEGSIELAKYHLRKKDEDKAIRTLDEAIKKNPTDVMLYDLKGKILLSQKKFDDAIKIFEEIEKIKPDLALIYIVNTYIAMKKPEKAMDKVRKELKKNPERLELMAEVSRLYKIMGKKQDAIENANDIIRKKPDSAVGYITLATVYQEDKERDKAIDVLKKAAHVKDANISLMLGNIYFSKKDYASALEQFRKSEEISSGYVPAIFQRGSVLHAMGKKNEAISEYSRVLRLSQNYVPALNNLAYLYAEENRDLSTALQLAVKAYTLAPRDGFVQDTLGFVLLKNGKIDEGLKVLKKAAETLPNNPSIYYHIALAHKVRGENAIAVENLQKALSLGDFPDAEQAKLLLGKLQNNKNRNHK